MSGIAGINKPNQFSLVKKLLEKISYRGKYKKVIFSTDHSTFGFNSNKYLSDQIEIFKKEKYIMDSPGVGHFAEAKEKDSSIELTRDQIGVVPIYYTYYDNELCFASEVKALLELSKVIKELLPGYKFVNNQLIQLYKSDTDFEIKDDPTRIANQLNVLFENVIKNRIKSDEIGSWLSGGLDSSALAALVRPNVNRLYTFSCGVKSSPDLEYAKIMAEYLQSDHYELIISLKDMLKALHEVIYHLESFDALLVRSSIANYLTAKLASDYVDQILSGEGGDEIFGGYLYLKELPINKLKDELIDITNRLHNTALQRVDRCASAFGLIANVIFLDPKIVEYALKIPAEYKIKDGIEKWILRLALKDKLPVKILNRTKAKFWEGAGIGDLITEYADKKISDLDFNSERKLNNGWLLYSKEELFYYRIFKDVFGELENFEWMGRTKQY